MSEMKSKSVLLRFFALYHTIKQNIGRRERVDIWTEPLQRRHLPTVERWLTRTDGALTPNDLPQDEALLEAWFGRCAAESGRLDCLLLVYETPVGVASLRSADAPDTAALSILLGERSYNPLRTAAYVTLRMLDRAFLELCARRVTMEMLAPWPAYRAALDQMGFQPDGGVLAVEKDTFIQNKYHF